MALARAASATQPVLVRRHARVDPAPDPWAELPRDGAASGPVALWLDRDAGLELRAEGVVPGAPWRAEPCAAFLAAARDEGASDDDAGVADALPGALVAWGSPGPEGPGSGDAGPSWAGWPGAWAWLPARLHWRDLRTGRAGVVTQALEPRPEAVDWPVDAAPAGPDGAAGRGPRATPPGPPASRPGPRPDGGAARAAWTARVARALREVEAGAFEKVVLARARDVTPPPGRSFCAWETARRLRAEAGRGFVFAVQGPGPGTFVGASPELLVRTAPGRLETRALAGTAPRALAGDAERAAGLLASEKDRREHALVVEALREALARFAAAGPDGPAVRLDGPRVVALPRVLHLETRLEADARPGVDPLAVARALHPSPAVGGAPRDAALAWLAREEGLERGWYAGALGWLGPGADRGAWCVAIRSALVEPRGARLFAGAGLVRGSDPGAEWDETEAKLATLTLALALAPAGPAPRGPGRGGAAAPPAGSRVARAAHAAAAPAPAACGPAAHTPGARAAEAAAPAHGAAP